jgi:tetratricopeptide (TPR) repeat protein
MRNFDAGRYEQALDVLKELNRQKLDPERKEKVLIRLADCYYYLGEKGSYRQFLTAVDYYKDILGRYPDPREGNAIVYYRLAKSYENLKFYYEALGAFESLVLKYPDSPYLQEATFKVGMMLRETRRFGKALEKLSAYLKKFPDGKFARVAAFSIGDCYYQLRQKDNAEAWYGYVQKKWPPYTF